MARIIQTADLTRSTPLSSNDSDWIYNGLDCCVTHEIYDVLESQIDPVARNTYEFSKALQGPVLEMMLRGLRVNELRRQEMLHRTRKKITELSERLDVLFEQGVGRSVKWTSHVQLKDFFYRTLGLTPVRKRNSKGQMAPSVDRDALEKLQRYFIAEPFVLYLLKLRDLDKKRQFLETGIDPDSRFRTTINIAGTNTGRLASSDSPFETGCVLPSAEALTPQGWKTVDQIKDGDLIAQWHYGQIKFVPCVMNRFHHDAPLFKMKTEQLQLSVTGNHRVAWRAYHHDSYRVSSAAELAYSRQIYVPLAGTAVGGTLEVPRICAMLMADFSLEGNVWRGALKKQRKIDRALALMDGYSWQEQRAPEGYRRFSISNLQHYPKKWGPWVLHLTPESAKALVDEACYWDAHQRDKSFIFYTADKTQAEWFQILCHLVGCSTTLRSQRNSDAAYGQNSVIWGVNVKPRDEAQVLAKHWSEEHYVGEVFCPTVPSGFWLVRENGFISVTGNSNLQNVDRDLRSIFVSDPGYKFCNVDLEQADARNVGALIWNIFVNSHGERAAGAYLDACESGDLHTTVCRMAWQNLNWGDDRKNWRAIADQIAYRNMSYRDLAKRLGHGTNYLGTPNTMAKHTKVARQLIEDFQYQYFVNAFPLIGSTNKKDRHAQHWHNWVRNELLTKSFLQTPHFNRRRFFWGRAFEDDTLREAIAYCPQSMTADEVDTGLLQVWRADKPVLTMIQVHDSILFQYPEAQEAELVPWIIETMKVPFDLEGGRTFCVPTEAKIGWNWGDANGENPDGLIKWKGGDDRKRQEMTGKALSFGAL